MMKLGQVKGLKTALITPYGTHDLVESTTRTNKQVQSRLHTDKPKTCPII